MRAFVHVPKLFRFGYEATRGIKKMPGVSVYLYIGTPGVWKIGGSIK
jgi:hypothetical protein